MPEVQVVPKLHGWLVVVGEDNDKFFYYEPDAHARKQEIENDYPRWSADHRKQQEKWDQ